MYGESQAEVRKDVVQDLEEQDEKREGKVRTMVVRQGNARKIQE